MKIDNVLANASRPAVHPQSLLALPPGKAVQAQQIAVGRLHNMLFGIVAMDGAEINKVACIAYFPDNICKKKKFSHPFIFVSFFPRQKRKNISRAL